MSEDRIILSLPGEQATCRSARAAARRWHAGEPPLIFLSGELGSGKSTWARAFILALGWQGPVPSPSYTLVERYPVAQGQLVHVDLFRLAYPAEVELLGLREMYGTTTMLVEWPSRGRGRLPRPDMLLRFAWCQEGRLVRARSLTKTGLRMLAAMAAACPMKDNSTMAC